MWKQDYKNKILQESVFSCLGILLYFSSYSYSSLPAFIIFLGVRVHTLYSQYTVYHADNYRNIGEKYVLYNRAL